MADAHEESLNLKKLSASDTSSGARRFPIRIAQDGTWFHEGRPIRRLPLVKLFSTVLRRDSAGAFWLQTPVEKGQIEVEDAPFTAVDVTVEGSGKSQVLRFQTNLDDWVACDAAHPLRVEAGEEGAPRPYILVRDRLEALILRPVFYRLAELAVAGDGDRDGTLGVWSRDSFFALEAPTKAGDEG
ncbi:MAG TPA: DUF1285 domain-containing protein [Kiloniellaceae bacterium]|nr:DUF1285 domain-containing protein [Kiloniellaceae bacterium]